MLTMLGYQMLRRRLVLDLGIGFGKSLLCTLNGDLEELC